MTLDDMEEIVFGCCGVTAWLPKRFMEEKRKTGQDFWCPNGHSRCFRKTALDKLQDDFDRVRRERDLKEAELMKLKQGQCPFCREKVKNLTAHIQKKHP